MYFSSDHGCSSWKQGWPSFRSRGCPHFELVDRTVWLCWPYEKGKCELPKSVLSTLVGVFGMSFTSFGKSYGFPCKVIKVSVEADVAIVPMWREKERGSVEISPLVYGTCHRVWKTLLYSNWYLICISNVWWREAYLGDFVKYIFTIGLRLDLCHELISYLAW